MTEAEKNTHSWLENWSIILMSIAALLTAWCAYQTNLWTGTQTEILTRGINIETEAAKVFLDLEQHKAMDGIVAIALVQALAEERERSIKELTDRTRPEFSSIIKEWLSLQPLSNKEAPKHPLAMPQYSSVILKPSLDRVAALKQSHKHSRIRAKHAGAHSDRYVLITVLLALVLFLTGISTTVHSLFLRKVLVLLASLTSLASMIFIVMAPKLFG